MDTHSTKISLPKLQKYAHILLEEIGGHYHPHQLGHSLSTKLKTDPQHDARKLGKIMSFT